jgi:hypothetical protein
VVAGTSAETCFKHYRRPAREGWSGRLQIHLTSGGGPTSTQSTVPELHDSVSRQSLTASTHTGFFLVACAPKDQAPSVLATTSIGLAGRMRRPRAGFRLRVNGQLCCGLQPTRPEPHRLDILKDIVQQSMPGQRKARASCFLSFPQSLQRNRSGLQWLPLCLPHKPV